MGWNPVILRITEMVLTLVVVSVLFLYGALAWALECSSRSKRSDKEQIKMWDNAIESYM